MKKTLSVILAIIILFFVLQGVRTFRRNFLPKDEFRVLLLYNPALYRNHPGVLREYEKALEEEGVPYKSVNPYAILSRNFEDLLESNPVIIIPDGISQNLPKDISLWFRNYLTGGGNVLIVYDGGVKNRKGMYLEKEIFSELLGFNYIEYQQLKDKTYTKGFIKFKDAESAGFFETPVELIDADNIICRRSQEKLEVHFSRIDTAGKIRDEQIYAYAVTGEGEQYPALVSANFGAGKLFYANLPLGYMKLLYADEFPLLKAVLKTFLFKIVSIPRFIGHNVNNTRDQVRYFPSR